MFNIFLKIIYFYFYGKSMTFIYGRIKIRWKVCQLKYIIIILNKNRITPYPINFICLRYSFWIFL